MMAPLNTKVVTASTSRLAGGLFSSVRRLHQTLSHDHAVNVRVYALHDQFTGEDEALWKPLAIKTFPVSGPRQFGYSPSLRRAMLASGADIGHTHGLWMYSSVATLNWHRRTRRPYLISPHGMLDPWALKNSRWKKLIAWRLFEQEHLRAARCLRALCTSEADSMRQLGLKNEIAVIPNGIDLPTGLAPSPPPWKDVIEPGRKVLLFLSRIHPKKGLINLLRAWKQTQAAKNLDEQWLLAIAGWDQGGHELELKELATELGLAWLDVREDKKNSQSQVPCSVFFLGPQFNAAKDACYHYCDAFILPSFSEGLPMVVLEAWANAKPVIMTPECNLPEGCLAGAALEVQTTVSGIVAGLKELGRMTVADRTAMGKRAHKLVLERFTWSRVANQMQAVHGWVLGGGIKPDCMLPTK
jgi:glycosyltransferase involved in cell wall biosynthesis